MNQIVLLRHGLSDWNLQNRFTGWEDVDLTAAGLEEARKGAQAIMEAGMTFDIAYTSLLKRAIRTLWTVLDGLDQMWLPVVRDWRLNERHYGALTGLNKTETAQKFGEEQVLVWRRSFDTPPPVMADDDPRLPAKQAKYAAIDPAKLPKTECLKDTVVRVEECWRELIAPRVQAGKRVLIVAHGNSLRALIMFLERLSPEEILKLNLPTGIPLVCTLDSGLRLKERRYLADEATVQAALQAVANQGKAR